MVVRIGDLLVRRGSIDASQRDAILEHQRLSGRPFGVLAEHLYGVHPSEVEHAWGEQYAAYAEQIDPSATPPDAAVLGLITRRQAWQFGLLPMWFDGAELVVVSTPTRLSRAMRFAAWKIGHECRYAVCEEHRLQKALERAYPAPATEAAAGEPFTAFLRLA